MGVPYRLHWAEPYATTTTCGRSVYFQQQAMRLAYRWADVTCLRCIRLITEPWHGTTGGYNNHQCRCEACRQANTEYQRDWRARHAHMEPPVHDESGYCNYGCRCPVCTAAHTRRHRRDRQKWRNA